ncbi:DUF3048 domain-containing protein [Desmospora activa]|uniref:DUF3048 family protein n=1 Tax=Desmospora activa DSM 45169 TaxID=1121389 RepID=A0A2T4Z6I2_9BACL|nr:DUF3048 domain-containing protein [Desmospora activa]PTM57485.1 Protein of unknown function (DUF3048) [Desmospora activa DSM 45169]
MGGRCWIAIGVVLLLAGSMTACTATENSPTDSVQTGDKEKEAIHPYTGEKWAGALPTPVMVMVNNQKQARPQSGLHEADWVVEVLAEGEITRFAAFYFGDYDGEVGPVRSLRPYYLDVAQGSGAVVAHAGGSPAALSLLKQRNWPHIDGIGQGSAQFYRDPARKAPHNLYTSIGKVRAATSADAEVSSESAVPLFDPKGAVEGGEPAQRIDIRFHPLYEAGFRWDEKSERYQRWTQGELHRDKESGEPLSGDNVMVIRADHRVLDSAGRRQVEWSTGGEGMLFQQGRARSIHWEYQGGWLLPVEEDGDVIPLLPGKTWVQVVPTEGSWSYDQ